MREETNRYIAALQALEAMPQEVHEGFEVDFLASNLARVAQYGELTRFSDKQKALIRRMVEQYLSPEQAAELAGQVRLL